jgi:hypothetical protein
MIGQYRAAYARLCVDCGFARGHIKTDRHTSPWVRLFSIRRWLSGTRGAWPGTAFAVWKFATLRQHPGNMWATPCDAGCGFAHGLSDPTHRRILSSGCACE